MPAFYILRRCHPIDVERYRQILLTQGLVQSTKVMTRYKAIL